MSGEPQNKRAKKSRHEATHVIAIDVETTGPNVVTNYMTDFGASCWKIGETNPIATFYTALQQPPGTKWDELTSKEFWDNPAKGVNGVPPRVDLEKRLAGNVLLTPEAGMHRFVLWARELHQGLGDGELIIVISDTADFDSTFINYYLGRYVGETCPSLTRLFNEYRPTRDIDSFYHGTGFRLARWDAEASAMQALDVKELPSWVTAYESAHNPLADANVIGAKASYLLMMLDQQ